MNSNLDLVNQCDSFPYRIDPAAPDFPYYRLTHEQLTLGYITRAVTQSLQGLQETSSPAAAGFALDATARSVTILGADVDARSANVERLARTWCDAGTFEVATRWRDEPYGVYGARGELVFTVERAVSVLLGVVTYGVHMTAYSYDVRTQPDQPPEMKLWIPRRNHAKHTYGGMLDNTVAGGMCADESPLECLAREAGEEASLPEALVRAKAQACGAITYFSVRDARAGGETGLLQPECEYVYDLELVPARDPVPTPHDDEVECFYLWTVPRVREALARGEFKPNCALVLLDFFIRHGILTAENEGDYLELVARLHRRLEFPLASGGGHRHTSPK